jgi:hypothetical protein
MKAALLTDRGVVKVSGPDARRFLNGLFTADIETMTEATPRYAALLTPQGKILADFFVAQQEQQEQPEVFFLIDCEKALVGALTAKLALYKLRARVGIEDVSDATAVLALWNDPPSAAQPRDPSAPRDGGALSSADPRLAALGWRAISSPALAHDLARKQGAEFVPAHAYEAHRIALGAPRGGCDFAYGDAFPHEADMDQLNGVDFAKGCYVGQEVVSRMQHRGTARSRVVPVGIEGDAPAPGTPVTAGDKTVGAMGSSAGAHGLALLRLDRVAEAIAAGLTVRAGNAILHPVKPAWARFNWPIAEQAAV